MTQSTVALMKESTNVCYYKVGLCSTVLIPTDCHGLADRLEKAGP